VANEGKGIAKEELRHLFVPYLEDSVPSEKRRLGLGLPITKLLTETLGGHITASSDGDKETLFTVEIPVESQI
jgi:signal transduction histidine kinase